MQQISSLVRFREEKCSGMQAPSVLARAISGVLQIFNFPGERTLDSSEYQTLNKWNEIVAEFAAYGAYIVWQQKQSFSQKHLTSPFRF